MNLRRKKIFYSLCIITLLVFNSCRSNSGIEPLPEIIEDVVISSERIPVRFATQINVKKNTEIMTSGINSYDSYLWTIENSEGMIQDSLIYGSRFHWVAPDVPGLYTHKLVVLDRDSNEVSKHYTFIIQVEAWNPPLESDSRVGKFVFSMKDEDGIKQLYTINEVGDELKKLTNFTDGMFFPDAFNPVWDEEGIKIYFNRYSNSFDIPQIWVIDNNGVDMNYYNPSERGNRNSYISGYLDNRLKTDSKVTYTCCTNTEGKGISEIFTIHLATDSITKVTNFDGLTHFSNWHPDGLRLAFISNYGEYDSNYSNLYVIFEDKSGLEKITEFEKARSPIWSPDGTRIAFISNNVQPGEVKIFNSRTKKIETLFSFESVDSRYQLWDWSADGGKILVTVIDEEQNSNISFKTLDVSDKAFEKLFILESNSANQEVFGLDWYQNIN